MPSIRFGVAKAMRFGRALLSDPIELLNQVATPVPECNRCAVLKTIALAFAGNYENYGKMTTRAHGLAHHRR
jgi:hypothetical protein